MNDLVIPSPLFQFQRKRTQLTQEAKIRRCIVIYACDQIQARVDSIHSGIICIQFRVARPEGETTTASKHIYSSALVGCMLGRGSVLLFWQCIALLPLSIRHFCISRIIIWWWSGRVACMCSADDVLNKKKLNYKQQAPRSPVILILYRTVL